jgi:hypothetical protein
MADYSFLANGYQTPDPFAIATKQATLGDLSNQYTAGQIANTGNAANLTELQNYRALMQNPPKDANGNIDQDALAQQAQRVAPTLGAGLASGSADAQTANARAKLAHFQVDQGYADAALKSLGALQGDPRIVGQNGQPANPTQAAEAIAEQEDRIVASGVPRAQAKLLTAPFYMAAGHNPQLLPQLVNNTLKAAMGAQGTAAANTPILADTGGQKVNVSSFANQGTQPASIPNTLPPGGQQSLTTDQAGNPAIINRDPRGNITGATGLPGSGPGPQMTLPPGETPQSRDQLQQARNAVNQAAAQVPTQNFNSDQIIALAKDTKSGPGTSGFQRVASALGVPEATSYQQLGHFLALQQQSMGAAMGVHTNAGQELAGATSGTAEGMDGPALIKVAQVNKALANGLADFNKGMETAVTSSPQGVFALRQFQKDWAQNFNPVNYQIDEAIKSGDMARAQHLVDDLSPQQRKTLSKQRTNTLRLTTQGHL